MGGLSGVVATSGGVDWTMPLQWFGAFRFAACTAAAVEVFARNVAPRRDGYVLRTTAMGLLTAVVGAVYPVAFLMARSGMLPDLSMVGVAMLWIPAVFLAALLFVRCRYVMSWTDALSRWTLGLCVERFVTTFFHNWLFLIIVPGFRDEHPIAYMMICIFVYTLFLLAANQLLVPVFAATATQSGGESRTLIALYLASFIMLTAVSNGSMHVGEYWIPQLRAGIGDTVKTTGIRQPSGTNGVDCTDGLDYILWFTTSMAGVVAVVVLLFQYAIHHTVALQRDRAMVRLLAEQKERQYATLRDNIDFINRKTHDLKHQVAALAFADGDRRTTMVRDVQRSLDLYDAAADTGNAALDTLLTERGFHCARNGIRFSTMVRGCDWSAIDVVDLFTLLGNALDNAFEYVARFDDPAKRIVSLTAHQHGRLIVISVDNHFEGDSPTLRADDGLPVTTKPDAAAHGIGLKSIRAIARRYGGDIRIDAAPPVFTLQISLMT